MWNTQTKVFDGEFEAGTKQGARRRGMRIANNRGRPVTLPLPCSRTTTTTTISSFDTNPSPGVPCSLSLSQTHPCQPCLILCVFAPIGEENRPKRDENIATRVPTTTSLSSVHQRHHHHHYHHHHHHHHQSHHHRHELLRVHPMSPSIRNRRFGTAAL